MNIELMESKNNLSLIKLKKAKERLSRFKNVG